MLLPHLLTLWDLLLLGTLCEWRMLSHFIQGIRLVHDSDWPIIGFNNDLKTTWPLHIWFRIKLSAIRYPCSTHHHIDVMVSLSSRILPDFYFYKLSDSKVTSYYFDGSDATNEGQWVFHDGRPMTYFAWSPSFPVNLTNRHYVVASKAGNSFQWQDRKRAETKYYICEKDIWSGVVLSRLGRDLGALCSPSKVSYTEYDLATYLAFMEHEDLPWCSAHPLFICKNTWLFCTDVFCRKSIRH